MDHICVTSGQLAYEVVERIGSILKSGSTDDGHVSTRIRWRVRHYCMSWGMIAVTIALIDSFQAGLDHQSGRTGFHMADHIRVLYVIPRCYDRL